MINTSKLLDLVLNGTGSASAAAGPGSVPITRPDGEAATATDTPQGGSDLLSQAKDFLRTQGGGIAGGAAAGALATLLLGSKSTREMAGDALKLGATAALGALAYKAYSNYREGKPLIGTRASEFIQAARTGATVPGAPPEDAHALLLLRAMIAAALSDGMIDAQERQLILGRLAALGVSSEEQQFLEQEIAAPWSPQQFAATGTTPELRSEIYLASAIAIEADTAAEQAYLRYLAATLSLDDALVQHLEAAVQSAKGGTPLSSSATA